MEHQTSGSSLEPDGWWSPPWSHDVVRFKFVDGKEWRHFDLPDGYGLEERLRQLLPFVRELSLDFCALSNEVPVLFKAIEYSKPFQLEVIEAREKSYSAWASAPRKASVVGLTRAIESGVLQSLKRLTLKDLQIGEDHFYLGTAMGSGQLPALESLNLRNTSLGNVDSPGSETHIAYQGLRSLARALASGHLNSLQELDVSENAISDAGTNILTNSFQQGEANVVPNLKYLNLAHTDMGKMAMDSLGTVLASGGLNCLEELDVSLNYSLSDQGTSILAKAFQEREGSVVPNLKCLNLAAISMSKMGLLSLERAITSGCLNSLQRLDVSHNHLLEEGTRILKDLFQNGQSTPLPNLKFLNLARSSIGKRGMLPLAKALASGRLNSLKELDVSDNDSIKDDASAFVSALDGNSRLIVDIKFDWFRFPDLDRRRHQLLKRNFAHLDILAGLSQVPTTPAKFAKLYLCGNPEVGKTTLRNTLQRSSWKARWPLQMWARVHRRTRGIEVTQFLSKTRWPGDNPITLRVWDMAGQEDYHLVHNAFFPAMIFAEGRATTFVVVCTTLDLVRSVQQLDYWLRYIASSCDKHIQNRRHVLVVLNNIGGRRDAWRKCAEVWKKVLEARRNTFQGFLDIQTDLFIVDARKPRRVKVLKNLLSKYSRNMLERQVVPAICQLIHENIIDWSQAKEQFPVLQWGAFVEKLYQSSDTWPLETIIEAAAKYLHEAGVLIYIDKKFPPRWEIPDQRLVVLDPNWFCNKIVRCIFLPEDLLLENERLFRFEVVDKTTGSISIAGFKRFFKSIHGTWSDSDFDDLIVILLWLGLCYKGRDQNVFIPALISEHGTPGSQWTPSNLYGHERDQWVMGFYVEHERNEVALAPISLWHKFQVEIAQSPRFNNAVSDNDFVCDKYFVTFNIDFMSVLIVCQNSLYNLTRADLYDLSLQRSDKKKITSSSRRAQRGRARGATGSAEISAVWGSPTFDEINIFVMPLRKKDNLDGAERKQLQVDLASDLVEILLELWNAVCPGVKYVHRVVWPWPVAHSGADFKPERNLKVTEVQQIVQEHGAGREIQWEVGSNNWPSGDQLLSKKDKEYVVESVKNTIGALRQGFREAVELRIFPPDVLPPEALRETSISDPKGEASIEPLSPTGRLISGLVTDVRSLHTKVDTIGRKMEEGFRMVLKEQKKMLQKLLDTEEIFLQDEERTCPKYIYLGNETSGVWTTVKNAFSVSVRLHFACEAEYNNCGPHAVKNQRGLYVSELKDWVKTILPLLKVTVTVIFLSAKVAANVALPGAGLIVHGFGEWSQGQSLSEGIAWATGCSIEELDKLMVEGIGLDVNRAHWDAREIYGKSREAMTRLIGKLTPEEYEKNLGLRRVLLKSADDSSPCIVWICNECFEKFRKHGSSVVREVPLQHTASNS